MSTIVEEDPASKDFHWQPFVEHWTPPYEDFEEEEVMGELYASRAFRDAERDVLALPREGDDDDLPRAVFAYMFWSDATHTAQFGNSKLWPGYAFVGNQSMYMRSRPSARAAHHFVYFPMLDDSFEDFLAKNNVHATPHLLAHCRRELFHGVWHLILDKEFLEAYTHGIILKCMDGVTRRIYPRIFTYSADYPEKVLIATTRDMGICPCTRCTTAKHAIRELGTPEDRAARRDLARKDNQQRQEKVRSAREDLANGYVVNSDRVEQKLKPESYVPIQVRSFTDGL
ncbi:uncharacterized protein SCHCODRAFT_02664227 [Schizophyllum commune H4-8]|uniref:uncharacterized protein n=1 Tax=Schizophyllum commune (strain H4-8 / FGSC 9210) TaxID=578458 RepID=UPI00216026FD|nr:uncharacterized protein SCHCODRAFT_02664227 [Schizophyllum commune H4-8]KAI5896415.1 hypothetical protein SCHCODRAFT_02664227 [Schizophyllum commune H4-8]